MHRCERGIKFSTIIVLLLISPFIFVCICLTYCGAPMFGVLEAQCKIALKEKVLGEMAKGQKYPGIVY